MPNCASVIARAVAASLVAAMALVGASIGTAPAAELGPVRCAEDDVTVDGRVFPEPELSGTFLGFDEFQCGMEFLESQYPELIKITTIGKSEAGHPIFNVLLTDETVQKKKPKLLVVSSIHGGEVGGREGAVRVMEDMVDPDLLGSEDWVKKVLDRYVIHFLFPNPDGWVNGDIYGSPGAGVLATRGNVNGRDLNRQFPVKGYIYTPNATLAESEGRHVIEELLDEKGWFLGTDNHGQGPDTYAAAGLQIVGEFDYQKSETLARFADGITDAMAEIDVLSLIEQLGDATGQDMGAYHWGTLYDMLGYSASGSLIDYYNTASGLDGTGFATELTVGTEVNRLTYPGLLNQIWVDSIRAINFTMFQQAVDTKRHTYRVGNKAAYVFDPNVIRHDDSNGSGYKRAEGESIPQRPYRVTRMKFFDDLNRYASRPLKKVRVGDLLSGRVDLDSFDSLVLANDAMPEPGDEKAYYSMLNKWVRGGGNLIVTDAAVKALAEMGLIDSSAISAADHYVGFVDFVDRDHPLAADLRGVASQTYDSVPIGYAFPPAGNNCPVWKVDRAAWEAAGGETVGTNGEGLTAYGELPVGQGVVRFIGPLLPDPTEDFYHPYGLQNYAVTYTGYTLLQNSLEWSRNVREASRRPPGG